MNTVIYHRADFDGHFSAAVCAKFLPEDTNFIGWDYNDPKIDFPTGTVYVVDLSPECFKGIPVRATRDLIWIDHHKSSIEKWHHQLGHPFKGYLIDGVAACRLCWQYFTHFARDSQAILPTFLDFMDRKVDEPLALTLAGEYDVWDLRDERTLPFQFGLTAGKYTFNDGLASMLDKPTDLDITGKWLFPGDVDTYAIVNGGKDALNWQRAFAESTFLEKVYLREIEGLTFACLASVHARGSMWFPDHLIPKEADALLSWRYDGKSVAFSLYHAPGREHHDLSIIATKFGGGGHRGACGFHLELDQALELIR